MRHLPALFLSMSLKPGALAAAFLISIVIVSTVAFAGSRENDLLSLSPSFSSSLLHSLPQSYPALDESELAHLRWQRQLAGLASDDFSLYSSRNQHDLTAYRYSIAFSSYYFAVLQYYKLPAWRNAFKSEFDNLIAKMQEKQVWQYWADTSRGIANLEPQMNQPYAEQRDPVAQKNIMFSGHLLHMVNLYQMLYNDRKWDGKDSMRFSWSPQESYRYDNLMLAALIHRQMQQNDHHGVACEPNAVFPECNQHPVLGLILFDQLHQTSYADVQHDFFEFFLQQGMFDSKSHETAMLYLEKQQKMLSQQQPFYYNLLDLVVAPAVKTGLATLESSTANGWTGLFMHAWKPQLIEEHYPHWIKNHLTIAKNGRATLKRESWEPNSAYGFMAALAAEMGDETSKKALLAEADARFAPLKVDGALHYPYDLKRGTTDLNDRLLALARSLPANGFWRLHNKPLSKEHFNDPFIANIKCGRCDVTRAIYDRGKKALVLSLISRHETGNLLTLQLRQFDPLQNWDVYLNGQKQMTFKGASNNTLLLSLADAHNDIVVVKR